MDLNDFRVYLPKYLSPESVQNLFTNLKGFTKGRSIHYYTDFLRNENIVFQGDGIEDLLIVNLPDEKIGKTSCVILSNTCDIYEKNIRTYDSRILYSPIFNLEKYKRFLIDNKLIEVKEIDNHIQTIKSQKISSIFYLPEKPPRLSESIVFLDRINNIKSNSIDRKNLKDIRLFSLSNPGFYIFLTKISIHFSRVLENVDRDQGLVF